MACWQGDFQSILGDGAPVSCVGSGVLSCRHRVLVVDGRADDGKGFAGHPGIRRSLRGPRCKSAPAADLIPGDLAGVSAKGWNFVD